MRGMFSEADWIDRRIATYPRIVVMLYVAAIGIALALSPKLIDPTGKNIGTDFLGFWAAGKMARAGKAAAAYQYAQHYEVERTALPWPDSRTFPFYSWHYPPMFLMVSTGLALLPYGWSLALWMGVTLPAYLAAVRAILPGRTALLPALAFPGVFLNLTHGQNGFLSAGLLGGSLVLLDRRPWMAGILLGLLAYKPQFGLMIPVALAAGWYWRTILAAAGTVAATVALSCGLFGVETWRAFFESTKTTQSFVLEQGATGWEKMQSLFAAVRLLHGSIPAAHAAQALFSLAAAAAMVWVWRKSGSSALRGAAPVTASVMATPYLLDYDLMVLALPVAWLAAVGLRDGFLPWEKITLLMVFLLPLVARTLGQLLYLPVTPPVTAVLLAVVVRRAGRVRSEREVL